MLDRISVSVLQLRLEAIVQEMGEAMLRTAYSQILNSSRDFSTAICDAEGRLTAQAEHALSTWGRCRGLCNRFASSSPGVSSQGICFSSTIPTMAAIICRT